MTEQPENPFDLDAQEQAADDIARNARALARTEADDIKWLMGGKRGRRVMWLLLDRAGVFRSSFSSDPLVMALNEGHRNIGLTYLGQVMEHAPGSYATMVEENRAKQ